MPFAAPRRGISLVLAVLAGLATDAGFPSPGWWPLSVVGVALLFLALGRDSAGWNTVVGVTFGLAFFLPHLAWVREVGGPVPWVALSVLQAAFLGLFGAAWSWARRGEVTWTAARLQVPVFALLWVGVEEARSFVPLVGLPWGRLAFSQADAPVAAWASYGGVPLVSLLVAAGGAVLALAVLALRRLDLGTASGQVLVGAVLLGSGMLLPLDTAAQSGRLTVAAVQGGAGGHEEHLAATRSLVGPQGTAAPVIDLVVWPQDGAPVDPRTDPEVAEQLSAAARAVGAPLLVGTAEPSPPGTSAVALLWDPEHGAVDQYTQQRPTPSVGHLPLPEAVRRLSDGLAPTTARPVAGTEIGLLSLVSGRLERVVAVGTTLGLEVAHDGLVRAAVAAGAEVLVVQADHADVAGTDVSAQQLAVARLRAIEHGRSTVQVSGAGVSGVVGPHGRVLGQTGPSGTEQVVQAVALRTEPTPATQHGGILAWTVRGLAVACTVAGTAGAARVRREDREVPRGA